jgi:hypothetical protein
VGHLACCFRYAMAHYIEVCISIERLPYPEFPQIDRSAVSKGHSRRENWADDPNRRRYSICVLGLMGCEKGPK